MEDYSDLCPVDCKPIIRYHFQDLPDLILPYIFSTNLRDSQKWPNLTPELRKIHIPDTCRVRVMVFIATFNRTQIGVIFHYSHEAFRVIKDHKEQWRLKLVFFYGPVTISFRFFGIVPSHKLNKNMR
jgi:hypothetical protein